MHIPLHVFLKIFLSKPTDIHKQNQGWGVAQHLQALRFCLLEKLTDRRFNIRSPCSLCSLSTTVLPKKRGVMMDLVYGVYPRERDMSGRARSLHLMCDYYTCLIYIHADLKLLVYV